MTGRPTRCTDDVTDQVCRAIRAGAWAKVAAGSAGITERSFHNWRARARDALAEPGADGWVEVDEGGKRVAVHLEGVPDSEAPYVRFFLSVQHAEQIHELATVANWTEAAKTDWRAGMELLARRHPERWSPTRTVHISSETDVVGRGQHSTEVTVPAEIQRSRAAAVLGTLEAAGVLDEWLEDEDVIEAQVVDDD